MRMRKKKNETARVAKCGHFLLTPPSLPGGAIELPFAEKKGLLLEVGCGKGGFACALAAKNPDYGVIALERITSVILSALEKADARREALIGNLRFLNADASRLADFFPKESVYAVYLNFSDPWPRKGYWKRRLTHPLMLEIYEKILISGGRLCMKTDNAGLYVWTLEQLESRGWNILWQTADLHASGYAEGNIMTEYEKFFTEKGLAILALCAEKPERNKNK